MTMEIRFEIPGEVRGKGRPRAYRRGVKIGLYTDDKTAAYENRVALFGRQAMGSNPLLRGAISIEVMAVIAVPKSWSKKKQQSALQGTLCPTGKPDADNCLKALCDGLNGIVWVDDSQVVEVTFCKIYGKEPGATLRIREVLGQNLQEAA